MKECGRERGEMVVHILQTNTLYWWIWDFRIRVRNTWGNSSIFAFKNWRSYSSWTVYKIHDEFSILNKVRSPLAGSRLSDEFWTVLWYSGPNMLSQSRFCENVSFSYEIPNWIEFQGRWEQTLLTDDCCFRESGAKPGVRSSTSVGLAPCVFSSRRSSAVRWWGFYLQVGNYLVSTYSL